MKTLPILILTSFLSGFAIASAKITPIIFKIEKNLDQNEFATLAQQLKKDVCVSEVSNGAGGYQGVLFITIKAGCFESIDQSTLMQKVAALTGMRVRNATYTYSDQGGGEESYYVHTGIFLAYPKKEIATDEMSSRIKKAGFEIVSEPGPYFPAFIVRKADIIGNYLRSDIIREDLSLIDGVRLVAADNPTFTTNLKRP